MTVLYHFNTIVKSFIENFLFEQGSNDSYGSLIPEQVVIFTIFYYAYIHLIQVFPNGYKRVSIRVIPGPCRVIFGTDLVIAYNL